MPDETTIKQRIINGLERVCERSMAPSVVVRANRSAIQAPKENTPMPKTRNNENASSGETSFLFRK